MTALEEGLSTPPPPPRLHLRTAPEVSVARGALALTVYTDDPLHWARGGAMELFQRFVRLVGPDALRWFRSSVEPAWRPLSVNDFSQVEAGLTVGPTRAPRHLLEVRVVDDPGAESRGFTYREVRENDAERTGYLQIVVPADHDPNDLAQLALEIGHQHPLTSAVGGWAATWNRTLPELAFNRMHAWCKRYLGLDVQYPDRMALRARAGLPGISWLTLLGAPLLDRLGTSATELSRGGSAHGVQVMQLSRAVLVRAGERPELGDVNYMELPQSLVEAGRRLGPHLIEAPPRFPGGLFTGDDADDTLRWFHRLRDPMSWIG